MVGDETQIGTCTILSVTYLTTMMTMIQNLMERLNQQDNQTKQSTSAQMPQSPVLHHVMMETTRKQFSHTNLNLTVQGATMTQTNHTTSQQIDVLRSSMQDISSKIHLVKSLAPGIKCVPFATQKAAKDSFKERSPTSEYDIWIS